MLSAPRGKHRSPLTRLQRWSLRVRALASSPFTEFTACLYAAASASSAVGSFRPHVAAVSRSRSHGGEVLARSASAPEP